MDPQILLFRRQYLQLFQPDFLSWPPKSLLRDVGIQTWLYNNLFNGEKQVQLPAERYQLLVLKPMLAKIEQSIENPGEDEISDPLISYLATLMSTSLPSELEALQQKSYVTFTCLAPNTPVSSIPSPEPSITLLERRNLISGSRTTGFRTWEAALHLGAYLLSDSSAAAELIRGKSVFELGVGTGFLSILCAKILGARHVSATDGDEGVVDALKENLFLNGLDDVEAGDDGNEPGRRKVNASVLRWGHGLKGTWVEEECEEFPYDTVLGADITYDKTAASALATTLRYFFDLRPQVQVLIAGAVRNAETFEAFRQACIRNEFKVEEIDFQPPPIREQVALFYATAVPLKILRITR